MKAYPVETQIAEYCFVSEDEQSVHISDGSYYSGSVQSDVDLRRLIVALIAILERGLGK